MPRPRRRTFGQKVKRAVAITAIASGLTLGTAMAVSPNFRAKVVNTVEEVASQVAKRGAGAAAGAGAAYVYAKGKRGWRGGRETSAGTRKAAMIGAGAAGALIWPPYAGVAALSAAAAGPENLKKAGKWTAKKAKEGWDAARDAINRKRDERARIRRNTPRRS